MRALAPTRGLDILGITEAPSDPAPPPPRGPELYAAPGRVLGYISEPTEAQRTFDESLPWGHIWVPSPTLGLGEPGERPWLTDDERAEWSTEAEAEATRRGWVTARRERHDGNQDRLSFVAWRPISAD